MSNWEYLRNQISESGLDVFVEVGINLLGEVIGTILAGILDGL